jgi:formylglycine-generating enzyme required for sulfatase activity
MTNLKITRYRKQIQCFEEHLGNGITLSMNLIPPGKFMMGSLDNELGRAVDEAPQHFVTLAQDFFMGRYAITQAQWKAVAAMPKVERDLPPTPSYFQGDNRPIGQINWYEAVEFCSRLAKTSGRPYRLPTESEWEYACRAGTTTPFHFGEFISIDLANYRETVTEYGGITHLENYGNVSKKESHEETTDVGSFGVSNAFGLYDMHGNILEWCQDTWHDSYQGNAEDGSAWIGENDTRVLRGGSWKDAPYDCRSAFRNWSTADDNYNDVGLRVVCSVALLHK